jgi:hypothetical protein
MPYQEVWVDDIVLEDCDDDELINELKDRGYTVYGKDHVPDVSRSMTDKLYTSYLTLNHNMFEKELKKFFRETLDVYVR